MRSRPTADTPGSEAEAYTAGLSMLARRELSVAQVRQRLARKGYEPAAVEAAIGRLEANGALDDARVALAAARTRAQVKRQGRDRVAREIGALGIAREIADRAVNEVFGAVDERAMLEQALAKRLRHGVSLSDPAARRRVFAALMRQGFAPDAIGKALRARGRSGGDEE